MGMKCLIKHGGEIREKKETEEIFVNKKKIDTPIGVDLDLGAVRYAVGMRAEVVYGQIEVREKKGPKAVEKSASNQKMGSKSANTKQKSSSTGPSRRK